MAELYPTFSIPVIEADDTDAQQVFKPAPLFDFDTGDFVRDGANRIVMVDGRDGYILWVLKSLKTQRGACLSYIDSGIDFEGSMNEPNRNAIQNAFERTISETLLSHPCTERVSDFIFSWDTDSLMISFNVKPKIWAAFDIDIKVVP